MKAVALILMAVMCLAIPSGVAQETDAQIVPIGIQAGDGIYVITISGGGVTSLVPLPIISPSGPVPIPPVPPTPDDLTDRGKEIRDAALLVQGDENREQTAQNLAAWYRLTASKIRSNEIKNEESAQFAVKMGTNSILRKAKAEESWQPVRDVMTEQWTDVMQRGGSVGDFATLLDEDANGLDASAPSDPQVDIAMIIMLMEMLLEFLKLLPFGA